MTDRYMPNGTPVTPYEREVLEILAEECNEVAIAAIKLCRFGLETRPGREHEPNTRALGLEIGDAQYLMWLARKLGLADGPAIDEGYARKPHRLAKYMQTTPP